MLFIVFVLDFKDALPVSLIPFVQIILINIPYFTKLKSNVCGHLLQPFILHDLYLITNHLP